MHDWKKLTTRRGEDVLEPTQQQLRAALQELFSSAKDDEHPDCWVECGSDAGPLYTLSVFHSGSGVFTEYSDADMSEEVATKSFKDLDETAALALWQALLDGRLDEI